MMQFLSNPIVWAAGAAALAAFTPNIYRGVKSLSWPTRTSPAEDDDVDDLKALRRLDTRYKNCPEGAAAVKVLFAHFFHQHEPHA